MTPKRSQMNRDVPKSRKKASGKQAPELPNRKLDDQDLDEPIYFPYSQCLCDLIGEDPECGCNNYRFMEPTQPNRNAPGSRKTAPRKRAAKRPKRTPNNQYLDEPIYFPYSQCLCDLEKDSHCGCSGHGWDPQSALSHAIAAGKAISIVNQQTGESVEHLSTCEANPLKKPKHYNPETIAEDILRAEGVHQYLPALNEQFVKDARKAWKQQNDVYEDYLRSRR